MGLLFSDDPALNNRLRRQLMGCGTWMMFALPLTFAQWQGWTSLRWSGLGLLVLASLLVNLAFFWAIRSGLTARFRDPSLMFWQILVSQVLALVSLHYCASAVRSLLITLFVSALFFGVFGMTRRQYLTLTATALLGYAGMVGFETGWQWTHPNVRLEALRLLTMVMLLLWIGLLGGYVGGLRAKLASRNAELASVAARLKQLVSYDELTGVFNRRHLMNILGREQERAKRYGHSFAVCLIDLDHFKVVNDTHGHAAGDDVLRIFASQMVSCARRMDWVGRPEPGAPAESQADSTFGRYGGEEFMLVLPHTDMAGAVRCLERLREQTTATPFDTCAGPLRVTFSSGVSVYRAGEDIGATLGRADEALYRAKANGRDRTDVESGAA